MRTNLLAESCCVKYIVAINSEWMMVGDAKRPSEHRGPRFPLLRHTDGRYVLVVDERGTQLRIPQRYGRAHDQTRNKAAVALGKMKSEAKSAAARINGTKGAKTRRWGKPETPAIPPELATVPRAMVIAALYAQGHSMAAIARAVHLTRERVRQLLKAAS